MPNILVLTARLPYPVIGGDKLRIYNICKILAEAGNKLTLLSFVVDDYEARSAQEDPEKVIFSKVSTIVLPKIKSYAKALIGIASASPLQISYYLSSEMSHRVDQEIKSNKYDYVLAHLIRMAPYVMYRSDVKKILEMTDAISLNYLRSNIYGNRGLFGKIYKIEAKRVVSYERECLNRFDQIVVVSSVDRKHLLKDADILTHKKIRVISNGVSEKIINTTPNSYNSNLIVFIGNMRTYQNIDAIMYFVNKIYPLIRAQVPAAELAIIGNSPNRKILSLNGSNGITVTGKVNDVVDYIKYGCVSVCPVRIGAGIQNKILESMAMGIPVVTTSLSAEGMEAINGQHFLVADDPRDFALSVIKCMLDKYLRNKIGLAARQLIETKYQWNRQLSSYISLFS